MTDAIRYEKGQDNIVVLTMDMPGQSANTMNGVYREAMAATVLTRLRVGPTLLDAGAVARLYRHRISTWQVLLLVVAALVALGVALAVTPAGQDLYAALGARLADLAGWVRGLFEGS